MAVHRVRAGVDAGGRLTAWHQQIVAEPTSVNLPFVRDVMFTKGVDFFRRPARLTRRMRSRTSGRVDQLCVAYPDDGVAVGRQLTHGVRTRVGD